MMAYICKLFPADSSSSDDGNDDDDDDDGGGVDDEDEAVVDDDDRVFIDIDAPLVSLVPWLRFTYRFSLSQSLSPIFSLSSFVFTVETDLLSFS